MFRAYAIDLNDIDSLIEKESSESLYDENNNLKDLLKDLILDGCIEREDEDGKFINILDGDSIRKLFFPSDVKCHVFLSHSSQNVDKARKFAHWLKSNFEINSFIDSDLWGCISDLQKEVDFDFCRIDPQTGEHIDKDDKRKFLKTTYSASDRNYSTAHVHMLLCNALTRMIDSTECFFFLKSDESITLSASADTTFSPWIFHELATVDTIRVNDKVRKSLPRKSLFESQVNASVNQEPFKVSYPVNLDNLFHLNIGDLKKWQSCCSNRCYAPALKSLYNRNQQYPKLEKWEESLNWLYKTCQKKEE